MEQFAAAIQTGRNIMIGGFVIAAVLFVVVILLFVLLHARSLGGRAHRHRDEAHEIPLDRSQVIGRFPRRTATANSTMRVSKEATEMDQKAFS